MNKKILLIALVCGAAAVGLLAIYLNRFEKRTSGGAPVKLLIATRDIPLGASLTDNMLGVRTLPEAYVEGRHVRASELEKVVGVTVSTGIKANESLLWTDLATTGQQRRDLSGLVQSGMRAMTVAVSGGASFGGLLRPGDRVDILFHRSAETTVPLLQNTLVLAVGGDTGGRAGTQRSGASSTVTLSVTLEQSQILAHARSNGSLTLTLRNPDDIAVMSGLPEVSDSDIFESERREKLLKRSRQESDRPKEIEHVR